MREEKVIDIIAKALLDSDKIKYIVKIFHNKGLQIKTKESRHYNIIMRDLDMFGGSIISDRHIKKEDT